MTTMPDVAVFALFKGYAFLLFQEESSVQALIDACLEEDGKLYLCVSSPTIKDKPVRNLYLSTYNKTDTSDPLFIGSDHAAHDTFCF